MRFVQLTVVVHCKDFKLYLNNCRLKCCMRGALLLVDGAVLGCGMMRGGEDGAVEP